MNKSDKAVMQQALDALERVDCVDGDCDILSLSLCEAVEESIAALRKAIAQPEQPAQEHNFCRRCGKRLGGIDDVHTCTPPVLQKDKP